MGRWFASRQRRALLTVAVVAVFAGVVGCGSSKSAGAPAGGTGGASSQAPGPTINIGVLGAFSGALGTSGIPLKDAVLAWVQTANAAGGINGHPVKAFVEDDKGDPAASAQALRSLVETDHIVALVGVSAYGTEQVWADYLQAHNVPVVGGVQGTNIWNTNPLYYGTSLGLVIKAQQYLLNPKALGAKKVWAFYCAEIVTCAQSADQVKAQAATVGVGFAGSVAVSASGANYAAVCLQAKNSGADAVDNILPPSDFDRVISACHQQGYDPIWAANASAMTSDTLKQPYLQGKMVNYLSSFPVDAPAAAEFVAAMGEYYPDVDLNTTQGQAAWAGAVLFKTALKSITPTATVTSTDVVNGLNSIKNDDLGGLLPQPVTFQAGVPHAPLTCTFTAKLLNQKLVGDKQPLCAVGQ